VRVCAVIPVRDDAAVLPRLVASLHGVVDEWLVVDFGSTDDSVAVAEEAFGTMPGQVDRRPWMDPVYNGNALLEVAAQLPTPSHLLLLEPDMVVEAGTTFRADLAHETAQRLSIRVRRPAFDVWEPLLLRCGPKWLFEGWGYRRLTSEAPVASGEFGAIQVLHYQDRDQRPVVLSAEVEAIVDALGDRGQGVSDAEIELHLAMNYRELGQRDEALEAFTRCVAASSSPELTFYGTYQIGELHAAAGRFGDAVWAFTQAVQMDPDRLEPYHRLGRLMNDQARWEAARVWLDHAVTLPPPMHGLNVETWVGAWGLTFERAVALWWTGSRPEAELLFGQLLDRTDLPQPFRDACERNLALAPPH